MKGCEKMKIGIRLHDTAPGSLWERMCSAKAQGFDSMQLALSKALPRFDIDDAPRRLDGHLAEQIRGALMIKEMECTVVGCYLKLADKNPERLEHTRGIYRAHLAFAPKIGALAVGTESPLAYGVDMDCHSDEALDFFVECVRPLAAYAGEVGAKLAIEPVADHVVDTPLRTEKMLDALHSDDVTIILDAVNLLTRDNYEDCDAIVDECFSRFGDRISVLHLKDFRVDAGQKRVIPMPCGMGIMRYDALLRHAAARNLPMLLENTAPENGEAARLFVMKRLAELK